MQSHCAQCFNHDSQHFSAKVLFRLNWKGAKIQIFMATSTHSSYFWISYVILAFPTIVQPVFSKHQRDSQNLLASARCSLNTGKFLHVYRSWELKSWHVQVRSSLIGVYSVCPDLSLWIYLSHIVTKPKKGHVRPAKTQISLGIRPVRSESTLCAQWVVKDPSFLHADSWSESSLGEHATLLVLTWGGSLTIIIVLSTREIFVLKEEKSIYNNVK